MTDTITEAAPTRALPNPDTPFTIDRDEALRLLKIARDRRGADYVYGNANGECVYVLDGKPSCMVGQAFYERGYTAEQIEHLGFAAMGRDWSTPGTPQYALAASIGLRLTEGAVDVLDAAQRYQDCQATWGLAYRSAKAVVDESRVVDELRKAGLN